MVQPVENSEFAAADAYPYSRAGPLAWVLSHALRYPLLPLGTLLFAVLASLVGSTASLALGRTFDHVLGPAPEVRTLALLSAAVVGLKLGEAALDTIHRVFGEFLSRRLQRDTRNEFLGVLLGKSLTFLASQRTGDLMARATNDVRALNYMFSPGLRIVLIALIRLVVPIAALAFLHWALLLVPIALVVALVPTTWSFSRRIKPASDARQRQLGQMSAALAETLSGIEVVKGSAQEAQELRRFRAFANRARTLAVRYGDLWACYLPALARHGMLALGLVYALYLHAQGTISLGDAIASVGLLGQLHPPLPVIFAVVVEGLVSAERLLDVIGAETELDENRTGAVGRVQGEVSFEGVSFAYDGTPALRKVTFRASPGETIAIVGQTGSGKTTLTRLINRICDVSEGRVLVDGVDVRDWNLASLRSQISTIEQDVFLFSRSIRDNIAFGAGREVSEAEVERCAREAQAHDFITRFVNGYETIVGERGVKLSGGERQRIAIARALLADPRILILDDSTSAIDSATEDRIQEAMFRVQQGRTTFFITHRLSLIRRANRILVLRRGELVDQGTHEELLGRCQPYRRIFARERPADGGHRREA
jgi:ATP-binding cassette subfamily B protein